MRTSWIMSLAAVCGLAVFIATLAMGSARSGRRGRDGGGPGFNPNTMRMVTPLPDAIPDLERAVQTNPRPGRAWLKLARRYEEEGRPEDAKRAWAEAAPLRLAAARRQPEDATAWYEAGWAYWKLGQTVEATQALEEAEKRYAAIPHDRREDWVWHRLGWARKLLGNEQEAMIAWARARDLLIPVEAAGWNADALYDLACYRALLGEADAALATLEKAVNAGWGDPVHAAMARNDEDFETVRADPRFLDLVRRMQEAPPVTRYGPG